MLRLKLIVADSIKYIQNNQHVTIPVVAVPVVVGDTPLVGVVVVVVVVDTAGIDPVYRGVVPVRPITCSV